MKKTKTVLVISILIIVNFSCSSKGGKAGGNVVSGQLPESGKVHGKIPCSANPEITYALYLPSKISKGINKSCPVIIAFDPHASGLTPVQKYKDLAEKYGYILLGSNNSKNGQAIFETDKIILALLTEVLTKFPADTSLIYTAGFSGGSRVASIAALKYMEIRGVIGCSGGLPGYDRISVHKFEYFGCAGTSDFNLNEMMQLEVFLTKMNFRHFITTFDGGHEWPNSDIIEEGILWLSFNAMKDGLKKRDVLLIDSFMNNMEKLASGKIRDGKKLSAATTLEFALNSLDGLADLTTLKKELLDLKHDPDFKKQNIHHEKMLSMEQSEQQMMMEQLFVKDLRWWGKQIRKYEQSGESNEDKEEVMKNRRLLSFLSLLCYSNANAAIKQGNSDLAFKVIDIYELADPENPEPNYMRSSLLMKRSDTTASMAQLNKAIGKGFSDRLRVMEQPEFIGLKEYRPYFDLLQKIK